MNQSLMASHLLSFRGGRKNTAPFLSSAIKHAACLIASSFGLVGVADQVVQAATLSSFAGFDQIGNTYIVATSPRKIDFAKATTEAVFVADGNYENPVVQPELEAFLGIEPGILDALGNGNIDFGSAVTQTFAARAGDTLAFSVNFRTREPVTPAGFEQPPDFFLEGDFAFLSIVTPQDSRVEELFDLNYNGFSVEDSVFAETGYISFTRTLPRAGLYTVGFGVTGQGPVNEPDAFGGNPGDFTNSAIDVRDIELIPVPAPSSTLGLTVLGLLGTGFALRKKLQPNKLKL